MKLAAQLALIRHELPETTWDNREKVLRGFTVVNFDIGFVDARTEFRDGKWITETTIISVEGIKELGPYVFSLL